MRRTEREISDPASMQQVLRDATEMYIALNSGETPYVLPVNYVYHNGCIYFHCALEGRKLDLLRADPRIGFSTAVDVRVEKTTTRYRSVCGTGVGELVDDPALKDEVLRVFAARYNAPCVFPVSAEKFACTGIVCIRIETLTGKHSRPGEGPRPVPHFER
ncbi:pyridoxamine 5'-phosphate oxidase family protein [Geobacter sp. FeAm09]|uniref:pyridoxamine 5'-phosphate oxidase family protein n=1 Tax=Geobacter sp. FeAm09 TaxID=2597769 RepID=UPI00143D42A0|nr:pyridoxamine 5'-phosphate oxidase family protein [Geobacter sp. FeAm09]